MIRAFPAGMAAALALVGSAGATAEPIEIRHTGIGCVPVDRAQIVAGAVPAQSVARAELQFRIRPDADWYGVPMVGSGGTWSAVLPRPGVQLARFEYRIVMNALDLGSAETAPIAVRVARVDAPCVDGPPSASAVTAAIVIRVPPGAPVMPPVPAGFSPAGVVAAAAPELRKSRKTALIVGGGAAAAGIGAAVASSGGTPEILGQPGFTFFGSTPNPGATVRLGTFMVLNVLPRSRPGIPLTFTWRAEFNSVGTDAGCVVAMTGSVRNALSTVPVQLSAPLIRSNPCTPPINVATGRLTITVDGMAAFDEALDLPFTFVD